MIFRAEDVQLDRLRAGRLAARHVVGGPDGQLHGGVALDAQYSRAKVKVGLHLGFLRAGCLLRQGGDRLRFLLLRLAKRTPLEASFLDAKVVVHAGLQLEYLGLEDGKTAAK